MRFDERYVAKLEHDADTAAARVRLLERRLAVALSVLVRCSEMLHRHNNDAAPWIEEPLSGLDESTEYLARALEDDASSF